MKLTEEQNKIVKLNLGQHLVLAPPGTGKTELLVQRLSNAVKNGISQEKMICLTFTNRAAKNMIDRVEKEIGKHDIFIGNIHSFCNIFLRKNKIIPQSTLLLDEEDVELLFKELKQNLESIVIDRYNDKERNINTNELLALNTLLKQKKLSFSEKIIQKVSIEYYDKINENNALEICKQYERIKHESNFIDFDDLLTLTYNYLNNNQNKESVFEWLQIDEVQDLNPLQWAIVNKITDQQSHRVFFGDYEQAIFSFMGAKLEILDKVAETCEVHELQKNFRSPQYLLDLYNKYAKYWLNPKWKFEPQSLNELKQTSNSLAYREVKIPHEIKKEDRYGKEHYDIKYYSTEDEEIAWIIEKKLPREPKENTAILVRTNTTADKFANKFNELGVNYFKISGFDLFRRKIIKDLMAFFNIIVNDKDRNSWIRNFHLYGKIKTLKESRSFINYMFSIGINPFDFIDGKIRISYLDDFLSYFKNKRVVVFDTETTGLDTNNDDIIQIAAIEIIDGKFGEIFEVYINTDKDLNESEKIHHISKECLDNVAIDRIEALTSFLNFIENSVIIAHNLKYDYDMLNSNLKRYGLNQLSNNIIKYDSVEIAKRIYPKLPSYKLEYLLQKLNIEGKNSHNALDDVKATANLILSFEDKIRNNSLVREEFTQNNLIIIENFRDRFIPLYKAVAGKVSNFLPIHEVVGMVVSYMADHLKYKMEDNIYDEIDKLLRHMEFQCKIDEVLSNIKNYIPEYVKYKESDLVLGNEKIIIATVHKAKGLEFENVIIPGCTDDNYPSYYSKKDGEKSIIEDARLLYVAMTRTKKRLLITSHTLKIIQTKRGPWELNQIPSRFLKPILNMLNSQ